MAGGGVTGGQTVYYNVDSTTNPYTYTQQQPPMNPGPNDLKGITLIGHGTVRWDKRYSSWRIDKLSTVQHKLRRSTVHWQGSALDNAQTAIGDSGGGAFVER